MPYLDEDDQRRLALSGEVSYHSDAGQHESDFEKEESRLRREFNKVDIEDRYEAAVHSLSLHKQTPEMLIAIVSAKLSQNTTSFADQQIYLHNFFESFDKTGSGFMGETELRTALETGNIQFNDEQFVALFAYFDTSFHGKINWRKFINKIVVPNPKGGLAILPKQITSTAKIFNK